MKDILAGTAVLTSVSQFLCFFCCVVPTTTGILALLTSIGFAGTNTMFLGDIALAFHPWRHTILFVSVFLISLSWASWFYASRKAKKSDSCGCHTKTIKKPIFLMIATGLLTFNVVVFEFMH